MALTAKRPTGKEITVVITGGGTFTAWIDLAIDLAMSESEASAAASTFDQFTAKRKRMSGGCNGFLGVEGVPPALNDTISVLSVSVGADEITPATVDDATVYGVVKVMGVTYRFNEDPSRYGFTFRSGSLT